MEDERGGDHEHEHEHHQLYKASLQGNVATLKRLIQEDPLILHRVSLTQFNETPLHISAFVGHLDFCQVLLSEKPELAMELDSHKRSPLHLASAEGRAEVVRELLKVNGDACFVGDEDGRIPLHLAAMRGRVGVIEELVNARPESVLVDVDGENVLHLCVRYNHLDALRLLVELVDDAEFVNSRNFEGKTALELAAMLKQLKTVSYLLSLPKTRGSANEIQDILLKVGVTRGNILPLSSSPSPASPSDILPGDVIPKKIKNSKWMKYLKYQGNWIHETQGMLMLVATVIATVTFQAAINPPGGVCEQNSLSDSLSYNKDNVCDVGTSVLANREPRYISFVATNTVSFTASSGVLLLIISGLPLNNKSFMWLLRVAMSTAVSCFAFTFLSGLYMLTPDREMHRLKRIFTPTLLIWFALISPVGLYYIVLLVLWLLSLRKHVCNALKTDSTKVAIDPVAGE